MQLTVLSPRSRTARHRRTARGDSALRALSVCSLLLAGLFYGAAPLVTLWQAGYGIKAHDAQLLRTALDWARVRDGLKQDMGVGSPLALANAQMPASGAGEDELPAFGESFATNVVSHAIDNEVTPDKLLALLSGPATPAAAGGWKTAIGRIVSLRFSSPTRFDAAIRMGNTDAAPLLVSLQLSRWQWRITRIHLPADAAAPTVRTDRT